MRKKSHISLAKYIVDSIDEQELVKHKKAFYLGSILPDCRPSFITVKHEMEGTFPMVQQELEELVERQQRSQINMRVFYRSLGEVIHYIADYFTFPHNAHYTGTLRDHCAYEEQLKKSLKEYIQSGEAERNSALIHLSVQNFDSIGAICNFIRRAHEAYVKLKNSVEGDCRHIVTLCHQVVAAVIRLIQTDSALQALPAAG
ncbi:MAG: zinc dependent phospholipase C family protein [Lachnospiraceae bacterium]|nr:zinc dependent phospholipase C family protein [Lachnospiraceae bacterium]